eukprot:3334461-Rhodomonas_salina.1
MRQTRPSTAKRHEAVQKKTREKNEGTEASVSARECVRARWRVEALGGGGVWVRRVRVWWRRQGLAVPVLCHSAACLCLPARSHTSTLAREQPALLSRAPAGC